MSSSGPEKKKPNGISQQSKQSPSAASQRPAGWKWPLWALDKQKPCIQVWVRDRNSEKGGVWLDGVPYKAVGDRNGNHKFLCVDYKHDGEEKSTDFSPELVK